MLQSHTFDSQCFAHYHQTTGMHNSFCLREKKQRKKNTRLQVHDKIMSLFIWIDFFCAASAEFQRIHGHPFIFHKQSNRPNANRNGAQCERLLSFWKCVTRNVQHIIIAHWNSVNATQHTLMTRALLQTIDDIQCTQCFRNSNATLSLHLFSSTAEKLLVERFSMLLHIV